MLLTALSVAFFLSFSGSEGKLRNDVQEVSYQQLLHRLENGGDTLFVVNFWATWCKPCIEELPAFELLNKDSSKKNVKVLLVSLDFLNQKETRLLPFLEKNKVHSEVILMPQPRGGKWIDEIHPDWSGAIPATLFSKTGKTVYRFYEQSFTYEQLIETIDKLNKH